MPLAVIGAGLGRMGTLSLKLGLERLGLGPCYYMKEVFENPADIPVWDGAADGEPVDWDALFARYRSAVDFPAAAFWRELADRYPDAKIILIVCEADRWYQSVSETIIHPTTGPLPPEFSAWGIMVRKTIVDRVFDGNVTDREHMLACFRRHNDEVIRAIPPGRLLVYEVAQGRKPLCAFLGVPAPEEPFPRVNTTDEFRENFLPMSGRV